MNVCLTFLVPERPLSAKVPAKSTHPLSLKRAWPTRILLEMEPPVTLFMMMLASAPRSAPSESIVSFPSSCSHTSLRSGSRGYPGRVKLRYAQVGMTSPEKRLMLLPLIPVTIDGTKYYCCRLCRLISLFCSMIVVSDAAAAALLSLLLCCCRCCPLSCHRALPRG